MPDGYLKACKDQLAKGFFWIWWIRSENNFRRTLHIHRL